MDFKAHLDNTSAHLATYRKMQPNSAKGFSALHQGAFFEGSVGLKAKELMAIAIGITSHCTDCIGYHMKAAIKAGATQEDISETVAVAMLMGGGPAYMYGAQAMEAFEQLSPTA